MCVCTHTEGLYKDWKMSSLCWLSNKLLENLFQLHFHTVSYGGCHTNAGILIWKTLTHNIVEKMCSPLCLCCGATNLESTYMIHKFLKMNSGSCICFCDIYKHPKCHHIKVIIMKYWVVFISLISTDGKIWTHICTKTTYNRHSVSA